MPNHVLSEFPGCTDYANLLHIRSLCGTDFDVMLAFE
jgi:hypothetical protein